jgi:mono/diheme cytochrome c family protein
MRSGFRAMLVGMVAFGTVLAAFAASAQDSSELALNVGKQRYMKYCATCHGPSATGDGVASSLFTKKPPNLTLLAKNNGGKFPTMEVVNVVKGNAPISAHGTREMPVWGEILGRPLDTSMYGQDVADAEILTIANYLQSIQVK